MVTLETIDDYRRAVLVLANGKVFHGKGIGVTKKVYGELVFTTATATGFNCALTDPSNKFQIYIFTYPLIGNYGVPPWEKDEYGIYRWFEGDRIWTEGVVVHEACKEPSHYESVKTFEAFLIEQGIPGIEDIDTRELTQILRTEGVQAGMLQVFEKGQKIPSDEDLVKDVKNAPDFGQLHPVKEVSTKEVLIYTPKKQIGKVVVVDCGIKLNIIRNFVKRGIQVIRVPYNATFEQIMSYNANGVVISNGPGDPKKCIETIELASKLIEKSIPLMGICLGNQILGLGAKGNTYKLKYGHRGANKPVRDLKTGKCYITTQNHGYAVDPKSVEHAGFKVLFENIDDHSVEGLYHESKPIFSVQFHPEGGGGPEDTEYLFDKFIDMMHLKKEVEH